MAWSETMLIVQHFYNAFNIDKRLGTVEKKMPIIAEDDGNGAPYLDGSFFYPPFESEEEKENYKFSDRTLWFVIEGDKVTNDIVISGLKYYNEELGGWSDMYNFESQGSKNDKILVDNGIEASLSDGDKNVLVSFTSAFYKEDFYLTDENTTVPWIVTANNMSEAHKDKKFILGIFPNTYYENVAEYGMCRTGHLEEFIPFSLDFYTYDYDNTGTDYKFGFPHLVGETLHNYLISDSSRLFLLDSNKYGDEIIKGYYEYGLNAWGDKDFNKNHFVHIGSDNIDPTLYEGRELTEFTWEQLSAKCKAADWRGLRVGDYKTITLTDGEEVQMQIAGIDTYYNTGGAEIIVGHHIDWISKNCLNGSIKWSTTDNNNGDSTDSHPYMISNVRKYLLETVLPKIPDEVKNVIVDKENLLERRYSSSGVLTDSVGWDWCIMGKLWLPLEYEVCGSNGNGTKRWGQGLSVHYPLFSYGGSSLIKGTSNSPNGRKSWWLANVAGGNPIQICMVSSQGPVGFYGDVNQEPTVGVPLCFRIS